MVDVFIAYEGNLHCKATHGPSKTTLQTDAPVDHQGKGETFSPTDLVGVALGTCIATVMAIYAQRHGIELKGMQVKVEKNMQQSPRRIGKLAVTVDIPVKLEERHREALEAAAHQCPVHKSLHPEIEAPIVFRYPG
jgi:putative redox protein